MDGVVERMKGPHCNVEFVCCFEGESLEKCFIQRIFQRDCLDSIIEKMRKEYFGRAMNRFAITPIWVKRTKYSKRIMGKKESRE